MEHLPKAVKLLIVCIICLALISLIGVSIKYFIS